MRLALQRLSATIWIALATACEASAAGPQLFPVPSHLVPAAVVAAFILPAAMAVAISVMKRARRSAGGLLGLGVVGVGAIVALAYTHPGLWAVLRG
ncbi:MAG: hypothetical protein AB7L90_05750 [Hyphomicrobiaceae bacterium]